MTRICHTSTREQDQESRTAIITVRHADGRLQQLEVRIHDRTNTVRIGGTDIPAGDIQEHLQARHGVELVRVQAA